MTTIQRSLILYQSLMCIVLAPNYGGTLAQTVSDYDGNTYHTVEIGGQIWMQENLRAEHYADGSPITHVWSYEDSDSLAAIYGLLYDWDAAMNYSTVEEAQGACPTGWHIPSDAEWTQLGNHLGGNEVAGGKMKEAGNSHWKSPNTAATNESGFSALPAGEYDDTHYQFLGEYNVIWSSTQSSTQWAKYRYLSYSDGGLHPYDYYKSFRYSVRCVKNDAVGFQNNSFQGLRVYPNPVDVLLSFDQEKVPVTTKTVTVYNQQGIEIMEFPLDEQIHTEDMGMLSPGIYFLKINGSGGLRYKKILKR